MAKKKSSPSVSFETYLVLFRYFLGEIGTTELKSLGNKLNNVEYEPISCENTMRESVDIQKKLERNVVVSV